MGGRSGLNVGLKVTGLRRLHRLLSRDCRGCFSMRWCMVRFKQVVVNEYVYCADGSRHLVDQEALNYVEA